MATGIPGQQGSVLLLALVFVLMLSLIAASVVQTATLELRMAGNHQFREEANQIAKAIAAELALNPGNFSLASLVGQSKCAHTNAAPDCDLRSLQLPPSAQAVSGYDLDFRVTRTAPLLWQNYPIHVPVEKLNEDEPFHAALFEISVRVDGRHNRRGVAHVIEGVAVRASDKPGAGNEGEGANELLPELDGNDLYRVYWREPGSDPL